MNSRINLKLDLQRNEVVQKATHTRSTVKKIMAEFDRRAPIFERESVPFEVISTDNTKSNELFTVRVLYGHRPLRNGSGREKIFRFEMSDECNLIATTSDFNQASLGCKTPNRQVGGLNSHRTPHPSVIHAPFMTANRGREHNLNASVQYEDQCIDNFNQMQLMNTPSAVTNRTILLYELEVGESDFEELRRLVVYCRVFRPFHHRTSLTQLS